MRPTHVSGKRRIFAELRRAKRISRAELARACALTRPAVSVIVDAMIAAGMIRELGPGHSTGGKPPIMLEFVPASRCAIGVNLGGDGMVEGVICDLACEVLGAESIAYENDFESIVAAAGTVIRRLQAQVAPERLAGVGVAVSGIVDRNWTMLSSSLDVVGKPLAERLQAAAGVPLRLERRPNSAALAEALFGAGSGFRRLVYLTSGIGVGAGLVVSGEIFRGSHGCAGEVASLRLPDGRALEEAARPRAMLAEYASRTGEKISFDTFLARYFAGDACAKSLVLANAGYLAYAAQAASNLFDPDAVVLGGDALEFGDEYFAEFQRAFLAGSYAYKLGKEPKVLRSTFGRRGVAVGGAQIILDSLIV